MKFLHRLIATAVLLVAATSPAAEVIEDFHSRIEIAKDGGLKVTETIRVQAENAQIQHGIYRDFPTLYRSAWRLRQQVGFRVVSVRRDGKDEPWHTQAQDNGIRVYIGSGSVDLPAGKHVYELTYETDRQLGFFAHHDELYWNVTGNGWVFPIHRARCEVVLPASTRVLSAEAYTGPKGARGTNYLAETGVEASNVARFETTRALAAGEGITVVVTWPKGFVRAPSAATLWRERLWANKGVVLGVAGLLLVFFYYLSVWAAYGKDPERGAIVPLFEPPEGLSPAAVRMLVRMGYDHKACAANIIDMAVKGALLIKQGDTRVTIIKTGKQVHLPADERGMYNAYFKTSQLTFDPASHKRVAAGRDVLKEYLTRSLEKVYFVKNFKPWIIGFLFSAIPAFVSMLDADSMGGAIFLIVWLSIWSLGVTALLSAVVTAFRNRAWGTGIFMGLFSIPFVAGEVFAIVALIAMATPWVAGVFLLGGLMNGVFYHLLKAPTVAGRKLLDQIEGFKRYLEVAEKDRLNFEHPPARTPELFDKFLPYAFALDVDQEWAAQFSDVLKQAGRLDAEGGYDATWYSGRSLSTVGLAGFAGGLGSSISSAISSSSTPPGSSSGSSSSGSGGGGGGSSGGGGGGGGGGGW